MILSIQLNLKKTIFTIQINIKNNQKQYLIMSQEINWKEKYDELKQKHDEYKRMYSAIDAVYEEMKNKMEENKDDKKARFIKLWMDDNWKSITQNFGIYFRILVYDMADSTWEGMSESDKEGYYDQAVLQFLIDSYSFKVQIKVLQPHQ